LTVRSLFVAADGRLRAPWRIIIFLLLATICIQIAAVALDPAFTVLDRLTGDESTSASMEFVLGLLLAHAIMLWAIDKRSWSYVGLDASAARAMVLVRGWLLGALPILVPSLVLIALGWLAIRPSLHGSWWIAALQVSLMLLPAALAEELFSRGYIFGALREWMGWPVALLLTSIAFGLLHLLNPGANLRSVLLVTLAGVFLGAVLIVTGSLYAAWMAHWGWNWVMAVPLHVPVSGLPLARPDYQIVDAGPDWITGGAWGPEGGAGAAVGMFGGLAYLYWRASRPLALGTRPTAESTEPRADQTRDQP
jgi:membrane protease YdiL (CAAX protease family)